MVLAPVEKLGQDSSRAFVGRAEGTGRGMVAPQGLGGVPALQSQPSTWDLVPEHIFAPGLKFGLVLRRMAGVGVGILSAVTLFMTFLHPIILLNTTVCRSL